MIQIQKEKTPQRYRGVFNWSCNESCDWSSRNGLPVRQRRDRFLTHRLQ